MSRLARLPRLLGMLNWFIKRKLAAFEQQFEYDLSYARELLDIDRRALFAFGRVGGLSAYRKDVPLDVYYAAKVCSTMAEDCGPCTQLVVTMGLRAGVDPRVLASVVRGDDAALTADQRLAIAFVRAARDHDVAADELRAQIVAKWGRRALVSISFAIVASRIYPTLKYALGHGQACQRVTVADQVIVPRPAAAVS